MERIRKSIFLTAAGFIAIMVLSLSGCYYDHEETLYHKSATVDCTTINAKFSTDVAPIISGKCATSGCHDAASSAGGTVLTNYAQISAKAARINQRCIIDKTMPPGSPLTTTEVGILQCWINSGAPNN
jgi:uncharacterized membrane protein